MVLIIAPALDGLRKDWREAAENLGASPLQYWRYVALPSSCRRSWAPCPAVRKRVRGAGDGLSADRRAASTSSPWSSGADPRRRAAQSRARVRRRDGHGRDHGLSILLYSVLQRRSERWLRDDRSRDARTGHCFRGGRAGASEGAPRDGAGAVAPRGPGSSSSRAASTSSCRWSRRSSTRCARDRSDSPMPTRSRTRSSSGPSSTPSWSGSSPSSCSLPLIVPTAYWVRLRLPRLRPVVEFVTLLPFVIPPIILVFGLIRIYSSRPLVLTATDIGSNVLLVGGVRVLSFPYMYRAVDTGLASMDVRSLTEAAQSMGARWSDDPVVGDLPEPAGGRALRRVPDPGHRRRRVHDRELPGPTGASGRTSRSLGERKPYEPAAVSLISFGLTWLAMIALTLLGRGRGQPRPDRRRTLRSDRPSVAFLELSGVQKRFGGVVAVEGLRPGRRTRRVRLVPGAIGLRQDDDAAHDRRLRGPDRGHRSRSTART